MSLRIRRLAGFAMLQDAGRPGHRRFGVPPGGAFDAEAMRVANRLLDQGLESPVIELVGAMALEAIEPTWLAVAGAEGPLAIAGRWTGRQASFLLGRGEVLEIGAPSQGLRAYVAACGGFIGQSVLGSVGGTRLVQGQEAQTGGGSIGHARVLGGPCPTLLAAPLRVVRGPQAGLFDLARLLTGSFTVSARSDRTGLRLEGEKLGDAPQIVSEPACFGAIQVTNDGTPIILGPDGPTIGGYPKIAVVMTLDLARLGQLALGQPVTFECEPLRG